MPKGTLKKYHKYHVFYHILVKLQFFGVDPVSSYHGMSNSIFVS